MRDVKSIGISGSKTPLPKPGEGDIDIFIYCDKIPELINRQDILTKQPNHLSECKFNVFSGGHWGTGDFVSINGIETWLMYFTIHETIAEVDDILGGKYPDKLDNYYYPVGRCAMLKNISILCDKENFLASMKAKLEHYPDELSKRLLIYHLEQLSDTEDLERAVNRKDVLFYHFALDIGLDHFLQALFALNHSYFPSRKRSLDYINSFHRKPAACNDQLLKAIQLGSSFETLKEAYQVWCRLVEELRSI